MPKFKTSLFSGAAMLSTRDVHDEARKEKREAKARTGFLALCACFVALLYLAGCTVGPKYRPPSVQLQPFHSAPAVSDRATDSSAPPLDTWWTGFQDPELEHARAVATEAGAKRLPAGALNAQAEAFRQSLESQVGRYSPVLPGFNRNQAYYDLNVGATWEADIFGSLKRGAQAATAEAQAAEAAHMGTRVSIAADAADAYFQIYGAQIRIQLAKERNTIDIQRRRMDASVLLIKTLGGGWKVGNLPTFGASAVRDY